MLDTAYVKSTQIVNIVYDTLFANCTVYVFNLMQVVSLVTVTNLTVRKLQKHIYLHITFKPTYVDYAFWSLKALIRVNVIFHRTQDPCRKVFFFSSFACLIINLSLSLTLMIFQASIVPGYVATSLVIGAQHSCNIVVFLLLVEYSYAVSSLEIWTVDDETITLLQDIGHQSLSDAALYPRIMETSNSPV